MRSAAWLEATELETGSVWIHLSELNLSGWAHIESVEPAPPEEPGSGCLVLGTTRFIAREILALHLESGTMLELTPTHPLFVEGRGWTAAEEITVGTSLVSDNGPVRVSRVSVAAPDRAVFNLEVSREHAYRVGADAVWAHNQCAGLDDLANVRQELGLAPGEGTLARLDAGGGNFYGINAHGQPVTLRVNPISRTHAETDAFQQAANAGVRGGPATLYVV